MEKVLLVQHTHDTPPGSVLKWLKQKGLAHQVQFADQIEKWGHDVDQYSWLIVLGGEMNVDEEHLHPWLKAEKLLIKKFLDANKKIVGLCLGGQLIAEVLGGDVRKHAHKEIGWHKIELDSTHPLVSHSPKDLHFFQWHGYRFITPTNAQRFAVNASCDQGYTYKDRVFGVQFHPEAEESWVIECSQDPDYPTDGAFVQNPAAVRDNLKYTKTQEAWFFEVLEKISRV